jgi:hypothetical protein
MKPKKLKIDGREKMPDANSTKDYERLADFQMRESQKFYNRANFFIATEGIFFNAFITAITGIAALVGYLVFAPIVICAIGISLNIIYVLSSYIQLEKLNEIGQILNKWIDEINRPEHETAPPVPFSLYKSEFSTRTSVTSKAMDSNQNAQQDQKKKTEPKYLVALIYKWAPAILFVGWGILLTIYLLQMTGVKLF